MWMHGLASKDTSILIGKIFIYVYHPLAAYEKYIHYVTEKLQVRFDEVHIEFGAS